jgi:hypothetical protein
MDESLTIDGQGAVFLPVIGDELHRAAGPPQIIDPRTTCIASRITWMAAPE